MKTLLFLVVGVLCNAGAMFVKAEPAAAAQVVTSAARSLAEDPCPLCPEWLCRLLCPNGCAQGPGCGTPPSGCCAPAGCAPAGCCGR